MCLQIQKSILTRHFFDPFFCRAWVEPNHTGPLAKEKENDFVGKLGPPASGQGPLDCLNPQIRLSRAWPRSAGRVPPDS